MSEVTKYDILPANRQDDDIARDPFGLGSSFQVMDYRMPNHEKALKSYAEELVHCFGRYEAGVYYLALSELPLHEQRELARLYIEYTARDLSECIYGDDFSINNEFNCALLAVLKHDCKATRERLAEVSCNNILIYYKPTLNELLDDACNNYLINMHTQAETAAYGYYADENYDNDLWRAA